VKTVDRQAVLGRRWWSDRSRLWRRGSRRRRRLVVGMLFRRMPLPSDGWHEPIRAHIWHRPRIPPGQRCSDVAVVGGPATVTVSSYPQEVRPVPSLLRQDGRSLQGGIECRRTGRSHFGENDVPVERDWGRLPFTPCRSPLVPAGDADPHLIEDGGSKPVGHSLGHRLVIDMQGRLPASTSVGFKAKS
jgi:hypothetical protein